MKSVVRGKKLVGRLSACEREEGVNRAQRPSHRDLEAYKHLILLRQKDLGRVGSSLIGGDIRAKVSQAVEAPAFDAST